MASEQHGNRWLIVVGALIIQVSLGAVYIWSVFQTPLRGVFKGWTEAQVTYPAQIVLAAFALAVIFGGRIQDKLGPRLVGTIGGVILGVGLILAKYTVAFSSETTALLWLIMSFSVLGGVGIGMAYVCPIATCVKWFPDKRGLISGLAVAGFGAGAFFFAPLARTLISGGHYQLFGANLFPLPAIGVFNTFFVLGVLFLVAVVFGAQLLKNPPAGYAPAGWTPPQPADVSGAVKVDFTPTEMLKTPMFWILWLTYFAGCAAGLQVIMKASPIWQSFSMTSVTDLPVHQDVFVNIVSAGATAVAILAIFNAIGRIFWGKVSDNLGRKTTLILMFVVCGCVMIALDWMRAYPLFLLGSCIVGLCFGGYLALYPAVTADFYGTRHIGVNYGWMFTAYGAGGLVGPFLAAYLMKASQSIEYLVAEGSGEIVTRSFEAGDYRQAFFISGITCLIAAAVMLFLKAPTASAKK